jgi:hypothetical protein
MLRIYFEYLIICLFGLSVPLASSLIVALASHDAIRTFYRSGDTR